ncbi:FHA domain-containing protein [Skermanella stibiiresistens]|nr:FHA domain-containing protein [Skermanella stibiiresistens]
MMVRDTARKPGAGAVVKAVSRDPDGKLICLDPAQIDGSPAQLIVPLTGGEAVTLGRGDASTFVVASRKLSRQHAKLFRGEGTWGVEDLNSTNGVYVNGHKITTIWLKHNDEVRLGSLAFRFELDRPPAAASAMGGGRAAPAAPHDDDLSERTMMVGSLGAGKAVLEAVRKVEAPIKLAIEDDDDAGEERGPSRFGGLLVRGSIVAALLAAIGGAAAVYYPIHKKRQYVEQAVERSAMVRKRVIDRASQYAGGGQAVSFDQDLNDLAEAVADGGRLLATEQNAALADLTARMKFLTYEREFLPLLAKGDLTSVRRLTDRLAADLDGIATRVPADAEPGSAEGVAITRELVKLARILIDLRALSAEFPQVSKLVPNHPPRDRIHALEVVKLDFTRIRRETNRYLSVDYVLFNSAVKSVEDRDLPLLNQWKEFLGSNPA